MKYLLDTNILVFLLIDVSLLDDDVIAIVEDCSNTLYVSSVSVNETIHLFKYGKIRRDKKTNETALFALLEEMGINIAYTTEKHLRVCAGLTCKDGHKDLNDHLIIAQAISDKTTLISSDHSFDFYTKQGLKFLFNKK